MKIYLLLFTLLICSLNTTFGQNKKDKNGKRTGKWVFTGAEKPNAGVSKNGKVEEGYFVAGRKEGFWVKYHKDGKTQKLKGNYVNNRPEGDYYRYNKSGKLVEEGSFGKEKFKGELVRYYANGKIAYKGNYNNEGKESGLIQYFYENGKVELEYTIKNDVLIGELKRYYSDGSLREEQKFDEKGNATTYKTYKQSEKTVKPEAATSNEIFPPTVKNPKTKGLKFVPNGYNKIYNLSEEIWMDGEFKNGQLWDGKVFDYDKDGILLKVRVFKNGKYHSDGQL